MRIRILIGTMVVHIASALLDSEFYIGAYVRDVSPDYGSLGGETRFTIYGGGFSADQFSQNDDPDSGNFVYLVSESGSEETCVVHMDVSTEDQIICYTPEKMSEENYYVKVMVDGVAVSNSDLCGGNPWSNNCKYRPSSSYTPSITSLSPQSGLPGNYLNDPKFSDQLVGANTVDPNQTSLIWVDAVYIGDFVTMSGKIFSDRYGSNLEASTNGRDQKLLRVYVGPQDCGMKNGDDFFGLWLKSDSSDDGSIMCQTKGTSVGYYNASFILEAPFGRSLPSDSVYRVSSSDDIYMYQIYTDITSVSPMSGSKEGGLTLTIYGNYFDDRAPYTAPRAYIGDTECTITNVVVDEYIECTVAADPEYMTSDFEGNRGVVFEYWNSTTKSMGDVADVLSMTDSDPGYMTEFLDEGYHYDWAGKDTYVSRMTTFFTPPHDGEYSFMLRADDGAKLYVDGVEALSTTYTSGWTYSARMNLTTSNKYLLKVVHFENSGDSYLEVGAKFYDTEFTSVWTGKAEQETQTIAITSTVVNEVQELIFSGFSIASYTTDVQTVDITSSGYFRLGLYGVYTESLSAADDETTVGPAFNALPIFAQGESVTVVRNPTAGAEASFTFTFESRRGDFPPIEAIAASIDDPTPSVNVALDTRGSPDVDFVALTLDGAVSLPFSVGSLDAAGLETVLEGLFGAQCPEAFAGGLGQAQVYEDFEVYGGKFSGSITKETEPFCGRYSVKNPNRLFVKGSDDIGIALSQYSQLCFAYKGLIRNNIWLHYSYKDAADDETKTATSRYDLTFNRDSNTESTTWYYTCFDMMSHVSDTRPDDTNIRLNEAWISRSVWDSDIFVDAVYIGSRPTLSDYNNVNLLRRPAAMPNGAIINTVTVTSAAADQYTVTLVPFECGDQFPLFELENSQVTSGSVAYPSTAASYRLGNSRTGTLSVSRTSHASPPVMGKMDVEFKGNSKTDLNISLTDTIFGKELESLVGIGDLSVRKSGDCANFDMTVTFISLPGDQPEMIVTSGGLTGINAQGSIVTNTDGGLFYTPLTGDMLSTVHNMPQVRLFINDVPTKCSGNCSFQWRSGVTPSVTSVSPTSGAMALGTSIVISGSGFDSEPTNNAVMIGGVSCTVTATTSSSVTCDIGVGPLGAHKVMVTVVGKGYAEHSSSIVTFSYDANITSIDPATGSQGGGITLTVTGYGFTDAAMVMVGAGSCDMIDVSPATITCTLPSSGSAGTVDVVVMQESMNYSYTGFSYDAALTPTVSSIVPSTVGVAGGTITVSGSKLGLSGTVSVGEVSGNIVSYADNEVVFEVTGLSAGTQDVKVGGNNGFALSGSNVPTINVELSVTNVYPLSGSLQGGTRLTVTGVGFGNDSSLVEVDVGDVICDVESVTDTEIVCLIADSGEVHAVTNLGTHRAYGIYYAFDKPQLTIERGDFVHWSWQTPDFVNDINHAIYEVESLSSTLAMEGGFSSGTSSRNGNFKYQFTQLGTFYVWSGYVDAYGIKNYAGQIEVVEKMSKLAEVSVKVDGIESLYSVGGSADPIDSSVCQSVTSAKTGCSDAMPSGGDPGKFSFAFWSCATPVIDMVDQNNGTAKTVITITGEGFSTTNCQNEVMFSEYGCTVTSSSKNSVTCTMDKSDEPTLGVYHPVSLRIGNRGNALVNIMSPEEQSFGVLPNVEDITPTVGSLAGEARLTITGFGYGGALSVTVGSFPCNVVESSYTEIVCETPSSASSTEVDVVVYVMVNGAPQMATCETSNQQCKYVYSPSWTPTISAIDTPTMSGATTFTIMGTNFGTDPLALEVYIGTEMASVMSSDGTNLVAMIQNVPAGTNDVVVRHVDDGGADGSLTVTGSAVISSVVPSSGSIYGETVITISGNGFVDGNTTVMIDGNPCSVSNVSLSEVTCTTPSGSSGTVDLVVTSNSVTYTTESFNYAPGSTPVVSSVIPTSGLPGETLTISGSNLAGNSVTVLLDDVPCSITSGSSSQIQCTLGGHATGLVPVYVFVSDFGASNVDVEFEYTLSLSSINPNTGGTAGGQTVTLSGQGFSDAMTATICGVACEVKITTATDFECRTPANSAQTCDVVVSVNGLTQTLSNTYTYDAGLTPTISGVTPTRGGTGGGTTLTVSGSGFGTNTADVGVMIDGAACSVTMVTDSELECETGPHSGSINAKVEVEVAGNGIAQESSSGDSDFFYIDVWSSNYTWGGASPPVEGDFVVIPAGQTLLLDTDTPVLSFLLIQGGELIFDEQDIELQANIIMITDGGLLQVGTEDEPFEHKAIITLHGHHRSRELPIYGTKVLAVRDGALELHGQKVPLTWTRLAATASAGSSTIQLIHAVEWNVGDEIVIAATGHHHTQSENEKKTITAISVDKMTLTLDSALEASHLGVQETFDNTLVEMRGEVGLLTHNVVVRGNRDPAWTEFIEACPKGFNTGEFAVQTCFLGRFGDEIGSSQFGGMILVHAPEKDTHAAEARLSYIEVTFAGQAFRLGRYPVHFHLNGDMSTSYVRGLSIHETFNRAVNVHGTHNTMVEKTVIYNVMGGAMFLEDGIETGNTFQYNLGVFVRESSSLLNDDITPATFWVTNPNNTIQHNAAAGGSHFGYWYRMHGHPDGPSYTPDVCPDKVPLGVFQNNSAHSFGWFGLWMFTNYFPTKDGACGGSEVEPAVFRSLFAWNNEKGVEFVNSGALQVEDFVLVQNKLAGYEGKKVLNVPLYTDDSPMVKDSLIVGTTTVAPDSTQGCTNGGIVLPYGAGFRVKNVRFVNFATDCAAIATARITGTCTTFCGGYNYHFEGISFVDSPNKAVYAWDWEAILIDIDGSLTGKPDIEWKVLPTSGSLPHDCEDAPGFDTGVRASMCPPQYKFHRYSFNNIVPKSIEGKDLRIINQYGNSSVPFAKKRISHPMGWMCALVSGETYKFEFINAEHMTNISYTGAFYDFNAADYLFVRIPVNKFPDRLSVDGGATYINASLDGLDPTNGSYGDWEWDNINSEIKFMVHGTLRSKRSMPIYGVDRALTFTAFKCYYKDCIPPPDPDTIPPATQRPAVFDYWNDATLWNMSSDGYLVNVGGSSGVPQDYDDVRIEFDTWVIVNTSINTLGNLVLEGTLEFANYPGAIYELNANNIIIMGGRLIVGWPDDPFLGLASIILRGNHSSPNFVAAGSGPTIGNKAIGVFGGLDLHGRDVGVTWTKLGNIATAGDNQIVLAEAVSWTAGDEIVIGPSHYDPWETETFMITSVSGDGMTLKLNESLRYDHLVYSETFPNGQSVDVAAPVGLLTHNIKVIGEDYPKLYKQSYGARVLVGLYATASQTYTGYARVSNVEFVHTGQEGYTESYDARFSLAYIAVGTVSNVKPSSVTKCSFHKGFNSAVGAFGIGGLNITDNVVHHVVGNAIVTSSDDTMVINNMVALLEWTGAYQDRYETFNFRWEAGIYAPEAKGLILRDNLVTGSERYGFRVPPLQCGDTSGSYSNNMAYGNLIGVGILPGDQILVSCAEYSGFISWKNHDFGIYYQNVPSARISNNVLIDNRQGIFTLIIGPPALSHLVGNKTVEIEDNLIIGASPVYDCTNDVSPVNHNMELSPSRPSMAPTGGMIGVVFPNFMSGSNNAPKKPFAGIMNYNAIAGLMTLRNVTFAHFGASACNGDYAIATNAKNDDGQHPVKVEKISLYDVDDDYKVVYHRPNVGKINSADCVDMDCDALKKALLKDTDGTFLGHVGSVIPQSEFEWGTNPSRGLGDYRIPKEMVTELDGTRIRYEQMMPNKGVIRNNNCTYRANWQAYECGDDLNYEMLIIESMDPDTETRRLSPVAILGDRYIDLINGPQDHGWCSGYTCRKRVSTFMALVATEKEYLMHFTSTTPFHMRYQLLNTNTEAIKLTVWYSRPNRLDVYVDGTFIMPTNARINHLGFYVIDMPIADEFEPKLGDATGTNKIDHLRGEHTVIIKGSTPVEVITQEVILVSFGLPAMTVEDFYGANIVENLAAFLNIPLTKVRVVNVVSENGGSGRRKRNSGGTTVEVEIGDEPTSGINDTVSDSLDNNALQDLASDIVNECQVGDLQSSLNLTGNCETVEVPAPSASNDLIVYSTPQPDQLVFTVGVVPEYENVPLQTQPKIQAIDVQSVVVTDLGTLEHPWELEVSIRPGTGHPHALLSGTLQVNASNGWFNFTDLAISHMGTGYILDFNVTYPSAAVNFTLSTSPFDVAGRPLKAHVVTKTSGDIVRNAGFNVGIDLRDRQTGAIVSNIGWRNHTWYAEVEMLGNPQYGGLSGVLTTTFDQITGQAVFPNLQITGFGFFYIQFRVYSDPPGFNFTRNEKMHIMNPAHVGMVPEEEYEIQVKFNVDYDKVLSSEDKENEFEQMILSEYANVWPDVRMKSGGIGRGSITVTFVIDGTLSDVNSTAYSLCESISNSTSYMFDGYTLTLDKYMTIDNTTFYGVTCGTTESSSSSEEGLSAAIIAIIVVIIILVIVVVAALVFWRCYIVKKTKTKDLCPEGPQYIGYDNKQVEEKLFQEKTFDSMKFRPPSATEIKPKPVTPPISTHPIGYHKGKDFRPPMNITLGLSKEGPEPRAPSGLSVSTLSVHAKSPTPSKNRVSPEPHPVANNERLASNLSRNLLLARSPSPNLLYPSPASSRIHSPFEFDDERDSPMPPAEDLYHGDYITEPIPGSITPHLPPPNPIPMKESPKIARKA